MSTRNTIGGQLTLAAYAALANKHRPENPEEIAAEVLRLHRSGHSPIFIAEALRLAPEMVAGVLAEQTPE